MFARYLLVSALALGVDSATLLGLVRILDMNPAVAAAVSYSFGAILHYALSSRYVFNSGWLSTRRGLEFSAFVLTSLIGTGITSLIIQINETFAIADLLVAKLFAVAVSFATIYFLRKYWVFRASETISSWYGEVTSRLPAPMEGFFSAADRFTGTLTGLPNFRLRQVAAVTIALASLLLIRNLDQAWIDPPSDGGGAIFSLIARNYLDYGVLNLNFGQVVNVVPVEDRQNLHFYLHHSPVLPLLVALSFSIFGENEAAARLVPVVATIASLIVFFLLTARVFSRRVATLSMVIFATMPAILYYGRNVCFESLCLLSILVTLWYYLDFREQPSKRNLAFFVGTFFVSLLTDWPAFFLAFPLAVDIWFSQRPFKSRIWLTGWILALPVFVFIIAIIQIQSVDPNGFMDLLQQGMIYSGLFKSGSAITTKFLEGKLAFTPTQYFSKLFQYFDRLFAYPTIVAAFAGLTRLKETDSKQRFVISATFAVGLLNCLLFYRNAYLLEFWIYYLSAPIAWLAALGFDALICRLPTTASTRDPLLRTTGWAFIFLLVLVGSAMRILEMHHEQRRILPATVVEKPTFIEELGRTIHDLSSPGDNIVTNVNAGFYALQYYSRRHITTTSNTANDWEELLNNRPVKTTAILYYPEDRRANAQFEQALTGKSTVREILVQGHRLLWITRPQKGPSPAM